MTFVERPREIAHAGGELTERACAEWAAWTATMVDEINSRV